MADRKLWLFISAQNSDLLRSFWNLSVIELKTWNLASKEQSHQHRMEKTQFGINLWKKNPRAFGWLQALKGVIQVCKCDYWKSQCRTSQDGEVEDPCLCPPNKNQQLDSYLWTNTVLGEIRSPLKKLQQHSEAKNLRKVYLDKVGKKKEHKNGDAILDFIFKCETFFKSAS